MHQFSKCDQNVLKNLQKFGAYAANFQNVTRNFENFPKIITKYGAYVRFQNVPKKFLKKLLLLHPIFKMCIINFEKNFKN
jgi:hypothetical protein